MIDTNKFQDVLVEKLQQSGFRISHARYQATFCEVLEVGTVQAEAVIKITGITSWNSILLKSKFSDPRYEFKRILGFGYLFTAYIIAGLSLDPEERDKINELGALANLIISIYDHFLDNNLIEKEVPIIEEMTDKKQRLSFRVSCFPDSLETSFFGCLIENYLSHINAINYSKGNEKIRQTLIKAILSMYRANRILGSDLQRDNVYELVFKKSALPIVVMGLPAWIISKEINREAYFGHFRWMYKLGEFLAWIDDASDLEEDIQNSNPNLLLDELGTIRNRRSSFRNVAKKIAQKGRLVDSLWKLRMANKGSYYRDNVNFLPVCVISWLGEYYD